MKTIRSFLYATISITLGLIIFILNLISIYCQFYSDSKMYANNIFFVCGIILFSIIAYLLIFGSVYNKIRYDEKCMYINLLWIKRKIFFSELANIMYGHYVGGYWLNLQDGRHYFLFLPFCKKKIHFMSDAIKKCNSSFEILL